MADPASSGAPPSSRPPTVSITVDLTPSPETKERASSAAPRQPVVWEPMEAGELGHVLPGYDVLALIGSGGMGAVYRARQKSLDRLVAVKVLSPELAERAPEFTERFNSEASALARLSHPSIVHLFDCGRTKDGQLFIAMELVEGRDVAERLAGKQPLPVEEALSITLTVCEALAHAHQRGVIHRDIKPANVMLDSAGRVKITDFGLARIIQRAVPKERQTTRLLGTPRFTAPEALVPGARVDERADIFSTGVMLYQMLTGEVPRGAAALPSVAVPGLDPRFDAVVTRAMAEDPGERHASADELREALEAIRGVPGPAGLPAATIADMKKKTAQGRPTAPRQERTPPPPVQEDDAAQAPQLHDHEAMEAPRASLMPWIYTVALLCIGGFWGWQQWRHPDDGMLGHATSVNHIRTTEPEKKPEESAAAPPAAGTPAPAPGSVEPPPPAPVPGVAAAAPPSSDAELAETRRRIAQIQGDFDAGVKEWQSGQGTKFAQLDAQYLRAVKAGIVSMRNARRLDDLAGLEEEERLLNSKTPLPPVDPVKQPERARLRAIYDGQVLQIARAGAEVKVEIYNRLLGALLAYQSILKQTNKTAAAALVAGLMDQSVKERDALRATLEPAK